VPLGAEIVLALTFDIAVIPELHEDSLRVGVLSAERLDKLLAPLGVSGAVFSAAAITASAEPAAREQVAGLPTGLLAQNDETAGRGLS
jgi:hypothetical protein